MLNNNEGSSPGIGEGTANGDKYIESVVIEREDHGLLPEN